MVNENEVDYVLNGYTFINRKYIKSIKEFEKDNTKYKILLLKYAHPTDNVPLEKYEDVISYIKNQNLLIAVGLENSDFILVGKVGNVFKKSFILNKIGADAKSIGHENIKFLTIRYISIATDYLNSLDLYLKKMSSVAK
jgi:hypothetical protein